MQSELQMGMDDCLENPGGSREDTVAQVTRVRNQNALMKYWTWPEINMCRI